MADTEAKHGDTTPEESSSHEPAKSAVSRPPGFFSSARIFGPIEPDRGDLAMLACCLVTGMTDAASFSNWGIFVAMQTGNSVILGLSAAGLPNDPDAWYTTMTALASFLVGAFLAFRITRYFVPKGPNENRLAASALLAVQGLLILVAAALATVPHLIPQNPGNTTPETAANPDVIRDRKLVALIPLLSTNGGIQIATSRLLGFNELPINVLTSTYCDIMGVPKLLTVQDTKLNRRVASVVLLLAGAISSGWLMRSAGGLPSVLWLGAGIKILTGVAFFCFVPMRKPQSP